MVLVFLYLRALRNGCSESFDACHVRYPFSTTAVPVSSEAVAADVQRRQRPDGGNAISTKVGSGLAWHLLVLPDGISESSHTRDIISPVPVLVEAAERVVADIQRRQRPVGLDGVS